MGNDFTKIPSEFINHSSKENPGILFVEKNEETFPKTYTSEQILELLKETEDKIVKKFEERLKNSGSIPIGTIIIWPSPNNPSDMNKWLDCNGQWIDPNKYPDLAKLIGSNVPNYQGVFLRGYGTQYSYHYGTTVHSSSELGVLQGDAIRNITGKFGGHCFGWGLGMGEGVFYPYELLNRSSKGGDWDKPNHYFGFDTSRVVPTANENRPANMAVRYLIRALA